MAAITLKRVDVFPEGTVVKVWPATAFHQGQTGAPSGSSTTEGTVSSGEVTFSGLSGGTAYVAYASVSAQDRYLEFSAEGGKGAALPDAGEIGSKTSAEIDTLLPSSGEGCVLATALISGSRVLLVRKVSSGKWWKSAAMTELA